MMGAASDDIRSKYREVLERLVEGDLKSLVASCKTTEAPVYARKKECPYVTEAEFEGDCLMWVINKLSKKSDLPSLLILALSYHATSSITGADLELCCSPDLAPSNNNNYTVAHGGDEDKENSLNKPHDARIEGQMYIATDKLYDLALKKLVDVIEAWSAGGIPGHVIIEGNPIIQEVSTHAARNTRRKMEDCLSTVMSLSTLYSKSATHRHTYLSVFDGHGGSEAAHYAETHLVTQLTSSPHYPQDLPRALKDAYFNTDAMFTQKANHMKWISGSTGVTVVVEDSHMHVAWCGDSQAMLCRSGKAIDLVIPHSLDNEAERSRVTACGGYVSEVFGKWRVDMSLAVSRALGDPDYLPYVSAEAEVVSLPFEGGEEYVVLASDGLWDVMGAEDVVAFIAQQLEDDHCTKADVAKALVNEAKERSSYDNITVICAFFDTHRIKPQLTNRGEMTTAANVVASDEVVDDVVASGAVASDAVVGDVVAGEMVANGVDSLCSAPTAVTSTQEPPAMSMNEASTKLTEHADSDSEYHSCSEELEHDLSKSCIS